MILAAGLSPAWQQVLAIDCFRPGHVNRAADAYWCASGKVINVAVALHHLCGEEPDSHLTLAPLGGAAYDDIDRDLQAIGVPRRWVRVAAPTRVCTTIVDRAAQTTTELVENAGPITSEELAQFTAAFAEAAADAAVVVLTGSLPAGAPSNYFRQLLQSVSGQSVLDIRGPELLAAVEARPAVVKPNRQELSDTLGRPLETDADLHAAMAELQERGAQSVVVSDGPHATWVAAHGKLIQLTPPPVAGAVNSIGCGDCLAAGIAWGLSQGADLRRAVTVGMEAAAKNLEALLPSDFDGRRERICRR